MNCELKRFYQQKKNDYDTIFNTFLILYKNNLDFVKYIIESQNREKTPKDFLSFGIYNYIKKHSGDSFYNAYFKYTLLSLDSCETISYGDKICIVCLTSIIW